MLQVILGRYRYVLLVIVGRYRYVLLVIVGRDRYVLGVILNTSKGTVTTHSNQRMLKCYKSVCVVWCVFVWCV